MYGYGYGQQIIQVRGEESARMYQLPPNSSVLLLDETAPLVWLVQTDGAGYKTCTPYKIEKYEPQPAPNYNELLERLNRLEAQLNESHPAKTDKYAELKPK